MKREWIERNVELMERLDVKGLMVVYRFILGLLKKYGNNS